MKRVTIWVGLLLLLISNVWAQGVASPLTIRLQPYLTGLTSPVYAVSPRDGTKRLFIVQQNGIVKVVQPGSNTPTDFINISTSILPGGERGLLGLAFHPQYATNRRFFLYYTRAGDGAIQIGEYTASVSNPNVANTTEKFIISIAHPNGNHNGGTIAFGADGYLYAGPGDGGGANDTPNNAQNINQLLGKILRIDIDLPVGSTQTYEIPPTNPFAGKTPGADEIYAVGMRNPYRFSFDRGGTNQLWVGDVGQGSIEEIDIITLGGNYGWRVYEGTSCTGLGPAPCIPANYIMPVYEYSSGGGSPRCSVTGGYVYRGTQNTFPQGTYVYGDYCTGEIFINGSTTTPLLDTSRNISSFAEDEAGELYVVGLGGTVEKIVRAKASADFDGDFKTDMSVFRPFEGTWYKFNSSDSTSEVQPFGANGDIPTPEDYDADNIKDLAVFRPSDGTWYYYNSGTNTVGIIQWGTNGDIPAAGDFDGDARADLAIYRNGVWWIRRSSTGSHYVVNFGLNGDVPVQSDYDGDGITDVAVWRPSDGVWYRINSTNNVVDYYHFGLNNDIPTVGDYDGDGRSDRAVFRPSTNIWYLLRSTSGFMAMQWGASGDIPAVGDYDGDNREDIAIYRPSTGVWYVSQSSNGSALIRQYGITGDLPAPTYDKP